MLVVGLTIQMHRATLLLVICLFSVSDYSFEKQTLVTCMYVFFSDIIDKNDCIWTIILTIKS